MRTGLPAEPSTPRIVLRGARHPGDVAIAGGRIVAVGHVRDEPGDDVVDCSDTIITAGLVNTHHHLYQWITRGRAVGCNLFEWLTELYPVWGRLEIDDVHAAAVVGLAELARSGCTTTSDHHYLVPRGDDTVFDALVDAAHIVGLRLHLSRGSMDRSEKDGGLPPDHVVEELDAILASTERVIADHHDGEIVTVVVAPCSPFSVSEQLMTESAALARRHGLRLHTHLAETLEEERDCLARFGKRPVALLDDLGWIAPDVWLAHAVHLDEGEIARIGAQRTGVAHCPSSNARLGAGMCPVVALRAAGAAVGLGVDGAASNESGRLLPEARMALLVARLRERDPRAVMPADALDLATAGGADCLGRRELGRLAAGAPADVAVWPAADLADMSDAVAALVLAAPRPVRDLYVAGRKIVDGGVPTDLDLGAARRRLAARAERLWET